LQNTRRKKASILLRWLCEALKLLEFYETTFSDVLLEASNTDMKAQGVIKRIAERAGNGHSPIA
jgi:hypothetical protein